MFQRESKFIYKWLRNGLPLTHRSDFDIFPNGTLKLKKPRSAEGIFRCVADGSKLGIGAVISTACNVKKAGKCRLMGTPPNNIENRSLQLHFNDATECFIADFQRRKNTEKNVLAQIGSFVVIQCPFISFPAANITWRYVNNNTISFNQNNRRVNVIRTVVRIT